ncbi:hypothetical protein [Streptomyces tubercidicus]|uniref:hypothetical protein n=1 Tax=Streptomyces tubercidicus TaxID=47759 RepID=UPI0034672E5E
MARMTTGPALRLARSAIFAAVCVAMTGAGQEMASGICPPAWLMLCSFLVITVRAWAWAGPVRDAVQVIGATVAAQLGLHAAFATAQDACGDQRDFPGMTPGQTASCEHGTSAGMVLAHLVAGLLCGLWLWRGDVAVVRLGQALMLFVWAPVRLAGLLVTALVPQGPPSVVPRRYVEPARFGCALIYHVASRRGPPAPCAVR